MLECSHIIKKQHSVVLRKREMTRMTKNRSLGRKILLAMIVLVIGMVLAAGTILSLSLKNVSAALTVSNQNLRETTGERSSAYMT